MESVFSRSSPRETWSVASEAHQLRQLSKQSHTRILSLSSQPSRVDRAVFLVSFAFCSSSLFLSLSLLSFMRTNVCVVYFFFRSASFSAHISL